MEQEILIFDFSIMDAQKVEPGRTTYEFFGDDRSKSAGSVTLLGEHDVIDWIFNDLIASQHFLRNVFPEAQDCQFSLRVSRQIFDHGERPGDVDILLWPKNRPDKAVAIECKRVKVTITESGNEVVNKLGELDKGVRQANDLHAHQFYKTFVAFLIVTDGRNKTMNSTIFRHADGKTVKLVYNIPWNSELNSDVGILFIQLTQPTSKDFRLHHAFGICVRRGAKESEQPQWLTERIGNLKT